MKVTQNDVEVFKPITIVLETQEELDILKSLLCRVSSNELTVSSHFIEGLWDKLDDISAGIPFVYFKGQLETTHKQ